MKKIKLSIIFLFTFITGMSTVQAAPAATFSVNKSKIEVGQSVTATVKVTGTAAWSVNIASAGSTSGCSKIFADATADAKNTTKTFTVTCKATSTGLISFTLSGDITDASGNNKSLSGSKSVTVVVATPKSTNNDLKSLKVADFEMSPTFSKSTQSYTVTTLPDTTSITVNAESEHAKARVSINGNKDLVEGENNVSIVVTAENGATKTYTIKVIVPEKNPIEVTANNKTYQILRNLPETLPLNFTETKIKINEEEVVALYNEIIDLTLVYARDENENNFFYTYADGKIGDIFLTLSSEPLTIFLTNTDQEIKGLKKSKLTIDGTEVDAFRLSNTSNFYLVYGTNILTNETGFYRYDSVNNTLQLYDNENKEPTVNSKEEEYLIIIYSLSGATGLLLFIFFLSACNKAKMKKIIQKLKVQLEEKATEKEEPKEVKAKKKTKK